MRRTLRIALLASALGSVAWAHEIDEVRLNAASGVFERRLPFDVPFVIVGKAPANTTRVEVYWEVDPEAGSAATSNGPLVSGIDVDGQFRVSMEPVRPDHKFLFRAVFERRLTASGALLFRTAAEAILRHEIAGAQAQGLDGARSALLSAALVQAYEQALNEGQPLWSARGETELVSDGLLGTREDPKARAVELRRLAEPWLQADAERGAALERYRETASSLQRELVAIAGSASLARLLETLEAQPDSDPRNPRSGLFLPPGSRRLVGASAAEITGRAEGRGASQPALALRDAEAAEDADAFRERYRQTAEDLRRLREWLPAAMAGRPLPAEDAGRLAELLSGGGALRRAEQWAETQQAYAHEVQSALAARERALARWAGELEAQALGARLRQSVLTEPASSHAPIYVSLDLGVLYPPELDRASLHVGANVYLSPVNKKAPLRSQSLRQRLALTFGLTVTNIKLDDETRYENLLGEKSNVLVGLGYRVTRSLRLGGGLLFFLENDKNPLVRDRTLAITPYVSLSFDVDLVGAFKGN